MPCFRQEKSLEFCLHRNKNKKKNIETFSIKPYQNKAIKFHGLFGLPIAGQHLIVDERWTLDSLNDQLSCMIGLLASRKTYLRYSTKSNRMRLQALCKRLKRQCFDGRIKLQNISIGSDTHMIQNYLKNHKDMLRLYKTMPIYLIVDNMNQRTFVLRKERDRLQFRLHQVKQQYRDLLLERSKIQNRIRYDNYNIIQEEKDSNILLKKIENSNIRLKAIRNIHATYKLLVKILLQDEIFYEPILRSLEDDMEVQALMIKNILYMGMPVVAMFKELSQEYRSLEEQSRLKYKQKLDMLTKLHARNPYARQQTNKVQHFPSADTKRYLHVTKSMESLKMQLQSVEMMIKSLESVLLDSHAREIYPQFKAQLNNNIKLYGKIEHDRQNLQSLEDKMAFASMLQSVLVNNLSQEEVTRLERIKDLRKILKSEKVYEEQCMAYMGNRAKIFVLLRVSIWNLIDILRHVGGTARVLRSSYPNSYLKLPLLKFEILNPISVAPDFYEENVDKLLTLLKRKIYKLMKAYKAETMQPFLKSSKEKYHREFLASAHIRDNWQDNNESVNPVDIDIIQAQSTSTSVPNRKQIKALSDRLVEQAIKRDS